MMPARKALLAAWLAALLGCAATGPLYAQDCPKAEFEAVVEAAAAALRELNQKNKPLYQARLRELREKRNWTQDQFFREAAPLVQDEKIAEFDQRSQAFLERMQSMGAAVPASGGQTCKALAEVRGYMNSLVEVQTAKWTYMFERLDEQLKR